MSEIDFDPAKHRIVAVNVDRDSAEYGNHFHLSLPDLVREASELPQVDWSPVEGRMHAIEAAVAELKAARNATPLVPVSAPVPTPLVVPDYDARITALEQHASAHSELSNALRLCLAMAHEAEARTKRLEDEARDMHQTVSMVVPMIKVAMIRR